MAYTRDKFFPYFYVLNNVYDPDSDQNTINVIDKIYYKDIIEEEEHHYTDEKTPPDNVMYVHYPKLRKQKVSYSDNLDGVWPEDEGIVLVAICVKFANK